MTGLPAVDVRSVSVSYRVARGRVNSLKEFAISIARRQAIFDDFRALHDVSLQVVPGEVLGVIGPNGAGKSTLMKVIARVLPPSDGRVIVRGAVAPMIELGAGFSPELSGHENIVLYGTILGRQPDEMRERARDIAEWAGVRDFLDVPLRGYSSGMVARLAFAVATDRAPDVLLVDEVLSVGDAAFQEKGLGRVRAMVDSGTALVFVTHALEGLRKVADTVAWLDHGDLVGIGEPADVISTYERSI